jgi:hypothetical protein
MPRPKSAPRRRKAQPPSARLIAILESTLERTTEPALRARLQVALDSLKRKAA